MPWIRCAVKNVLKLWLIESLHTPVWFGSAEILHIQFNLNTNKNWNTYIDPFRLFLVSKKSQKHVLIVCENKRDENIRTTIFESLWKSACTWKAAKNAKVFTLWRCGKFLFDECLTAARWEDGKSVWNRVWPALWVKCRWIADLMFDLGCSLLTSDGVKWSGPYQDKTWL